MTRRSSNREDQQRRAVAHEAARIMAEQGIEDFLLAKRKAAERLMIAGSAALPGNAEIEAALLERQRLFHTNTHTQHVRALRHDALRLMRMLREFNPHLVGSVLSGSATRHADINLHVFIDSAERVALHLTEQGIEPKHAERKLRYEPERMISYPSFKFIAGQQPVEIVVFPVNGIRQSPSSPVDGRPMARASLDQVLALLAVPEHAAST